MSRETDRSHSNKLSILGVIRWIIVLLFLPIVLLLFFVYTGVAREGMVTGVYWLLCGIVAFIPTREWIEWGLDGEIPRWLVFVSVLYLFSIGVLGLMHPMA